MRKRQSLDQRLNFVLNSYLWNGKKLLEEELNAKCDEWWSAAVWRRWRDEEMMNEERRTGRKAHWWETE